MGRPHRQQFNTRHGVMNNEKHIKIHSTTVPGQDYVSACLRLPNTHTTHLPIRDSHLRAATI